MTRYPHHRQEVQDRRKQMQTVCVQCTNTPHTPAPLAYQKKKKYEKNEETMNVSVTENTFSSYIQLSKINNHVP